MIPLRTVSRAAIATGAAAAAVLGSVATAPYASAAAVRALPRCHGHVATAVIAKHTFRGGKKKDVVVSTGRNVQILSGGGNDLLCGGPHGNILNGGDGDDMIYGGTGYDTIYTGSGNDIAHGGAGNDKIYGGAHGHDKLYGDAGNDTFHCGGATCYVDGGSGKNTVYLGTGSATLVNISKIIVPPKHGVFKAPKGTPVFNPGGMQIGVVSGSGTSITPLPTPPAPPAPPAPPVTPPVVTPPAPPVTPPAAATYSISGTVTDSATGKPLDKAEVTYFAVGAQFGSQTQIVGTGPTGGYTLTAIPAGTYTVEAAARSYTTVDRTVVVAGNVTGADLALTATSANGGGDETVSGVVTDLEGEPLANIPVVACSEESTEEQPGEGPEEFCGEFASATTDETGHYSIEGLSSGEVSLQVNPQLLPSTPSEEGEEGQLEFNVNYSDQASLLELSENSPSVLNVALRPAGSVTGTLIDPSHPDASEFAYTIDDQGLVHYSNAENGSYLIEGLATGGYDVSALGFAAQGDDDSVQSGSTSVTVTAGTTATAKPIVLVAQ